MWTRRIRIRDIEISYNETSGPGRPLVMVHGLTGHRDDFAARMPELEGELRILAPDVRGHGDCSPSPPERYTIPQLVSDLAALLDAWGTDSCDLLGHSFGGMIALRYALAHPRGVASLVLMGTAPFAPTGYTKESFLKGGAIARERGMAFLQSVVEKRSRAAPEELDAHGTWSSEQYWVHHRRRYTAMDPAAYAALGLAMVEQTPIVERLGEIDCPTTILVGEGDEPFLAGADALESAIPHAVRATLPSSGHHPHMENPQAWLAALRAHLERARRARDPG